MIDGATGEEMDAIVRETLQMPHAIIAKVAQLTN